MESGGWAQRQLTSLLNLLDEVKDLARTVFEALIAAAAPNAVVRISATRTVSPLSAAVPGPHCCSAPSVPLLSVEADHGGANCCSALSPAGLRRQSSRAPPSYPALSPPSCCPSPVPPLLWSLSVVRECEFPAVSAVLSRPLRRLCGGGRAAVGPTGPQSPVFVSSPPTDPPHPPPLLHSPAAAACVRLSASLCPASAAAVHPSLPPLCCGRPRVVVLGCGVAGVHTGLCPPALPRQYPSVERHRPAHGGRRGAHEEVREATVAVAVAVCR